MVLRGRRQNDKNCGGEGGGIFMPQIVSNLPLACDLGGCLFGTELLLSEEKIPSGPRSFCG